MENQPRLECSVLTSSSARNLRDLVDETKRISNVSLFDLMLLRDADMKAIEAKDSQAIRPPRNSNAPLSLDCRSLTDLLSQSDVQAIAEWLIERCETLDIRVAAFATYFPNIVSLVDEERENAVKALTNSVRIALEVARRGRSLNGYGIVEAVCGNILDPCQCSRCRGTELKPHRIFVPSRERKYELLKQSLREVAQAVGSADKWAIALELEPGETYILNDHVSIAEISQILKSEKTLESCVGFNMDIAHMRIAKIKASFLYDYKDQIIHSHISDHPGAHTIDQQVGSWTRIQNHTHGYYPYLKLLEKRLSEHSEHPTLGGLPCTGTVALELEGCNRINWIHQSLVAMKHLCAITADLKDDIIFL